MRPNHSLQPTAFGAGEIEFDLDAVRVEHEQLLQSVVVHLALLEVNAERCQVRSHFAQSRGAEREMVPTWHRRGAEWAHG